MTQAVAPFDKTRRVVEAALSRNAEDVLALDLRALSSITDTFVLASGGSDRQLRSIADAIEEALRDTGEKSLGVEGYTEGRWVLLDLDDVIVHIFLREVREQYQLERLWSDAPVLHFEGLAKRSATQ